MNLHAVRMKFIWTSYRRTNEVNMIYPCNTNKLTWGSWTVCMKYIWNSYEFRMIWTSSKLHLNFIRIAWQLLCTTHNYGLWYPCYVFHINEPPGPSYISRDGLSAILNIISKNLFKYAYHGPKFAYIPTHWRTDSWAVLANQGSCNY